MSIETHVFDEEGRVVHRRGVTNSRGLYFLGLTWQHTRGSALLGWVKDDAEFIARQINTFRASAAPERRAPEGVESGDLTSALAATGTSAPTHRSTT
jgi:hypothetical protein